MSLEVVKKERGVKEEAFEICEVKYELNTVESLKKAKENIARNEVITRSVTNDENIRFEINSAVYLEVKKKASELKKGHIIVDKELGVTLKVVSIRRFLTKTKKDNPQLTIQFEVHDLKSNQTTKCSQHLYHTNQVVHLQGPPQHPF